MIFDVISWSTTTKGRVHIGKKNNQVDFQPDMNKDGKENVKWMCNL